MLTSVVGQHPNKKISIDVSIAFYDIFNILETQISGRGGGGGLTQINHKRDIENDLKFDITPVILGHNWYYHKSAIVRDKIGQHSGTTD